MRVPGGIWEQMSTLFLTALVVLQRNGLRMVCKTTEKLKLNLLVVLLQFPENMIILFDLLYYSLINAATI